MRKLINKFLFVLFLVSLSFTLIACDYMYGLYSNIDKEVIGIELIYYDNPDARSNPLEKYPFDINKLEVLEILDYAKKEPFLDKLSKIFSLGSMYRQVLYSHDGIGVKITYEDNFFTIITLTVINSKDYFFVGEYSSSANQIESKSVDIPSMANDFKDIIAEYFDYTN